MELFSSPKTAAGNDAQITAFKSEGSPLWLGIAAIIGIGSGLLGLALSQAVAGAAYSMTLFLPLGFCATMAILGRDKIAIGGRLFWWQLLGFPLMIAVTIGTATLVRTLSPGNGGNSSMLLVVACIAPFWLARMFEGEKRRQMEAISLWVSVVVLIVFAGVTLNVIWNHWPVQAAPIQMALSEAISWGAGMFLMALGFWFARIVIGRRPSHLPPAWGEGRA